ncbi:MAG: PepSY domain-containing protein [Devosia sp.]
MTFRTNLAALLALTVLSGGVAHAEQNDQAAETSAVAHATITAAEAIAAVEKQGTGKVVELALEANGPGVVYRVTLMTADGTASTFTVDATTGAVMAAGQSSDNAEVAGTSTEGENADEGPESQEQGED